MSSEIATATCRCGEVTPEAIQCPVHFHVYRYGTWLPSVGRILRTVWPPPETLPPEDVLENARLRGVEVDTLFSAYVIGKLQRIPAGTRMDARDLFLKLVYWFDEQHFTRSESQILVAGDDHAGTMDLRLDGMVVDLKCTYDVSDMHRLQTAGYAALAGTLDAAVLHVTARYPEPRLELLTGTDHHDWEALLCHWRMLKRRNAITVTP